MPLSQHIDAGSFVSLNKEYLRLALPDGGALHVTRKTPLHAPRGAVILVHGFCQNRYSFHLPARSFTASLVAAGFDTWNVDLRGHGRSHDPHAPAPTFERHAFEDIPTVYRACVETTGQTPFLVAHSLGAAICLAAAPKLDPLPRGIVSIAGPLRIGGAAVALGAAVQVGRFWRVWPHRAVPFQPLAQLVALRPEILGLSPPLLPHICAPGATEPAVMAELLRLSFDRAWLPLAGSLARWGVTGRFDGPQGEDYAAAFRTIDVPLYAAAGAQDRLIHADEVLPAFETSGSADRTFRLFGSVADGVPFGHVDLLCGKHAPRLVWHEITAWLRARS